MKKAKKYIDFVITKIHQSLHEKKFSYQGVDLRYMFEKNPQSESLIVIFSACTRKGITARYNYVRTLSAIGSNKLFILDDFAEDKRGAYYLGKNLGNEIEQACKALISEMMIKHACKKLLFCGSSKGGWAALNLMCEFPQSVAIIGAPQYRLADYLLAPALEKCQKYVMPELNQKSVDYLNSYLSNKLLKAKEDKHYIYLHYSDSEHTYDEHIKYLLEDLKQFGYAYSLDVKQYSDHWDVSKYFPDYLIDSIERYMC